MEITRASCASTALARAASASARGGQTPRRCSLELCSGISFAHGGQTAPRCSLELCSGVSFGSTIGIVGIGRSWFCCFHVLQSYVSLIGISLWFLSFGYVCFM